MSHKFKIRDHRGEESPKLEVLARSANRTEQAKAQVYASDVKKSLTGEG